MASAWRSGDIQDVGRADAPGRPGRPDKPVLRPPREVPKRRISAAPEGRVALLHALAHIELNAIDLACDIVFRFTEESLPRAYYDDWVRVADEEAKHFLLLDERLRDLGAAYGDLPAHDGLWQAAEATAHDLLARLAVVPLVLEARGLDVTPQMIEKLEAVGDRDSAKALRIIYEDEKGHVAIGKRWFDWLCERRGKEPRAAWRTLVQRHFNGQIKPPFNAEARSAAGLPPAFYRDLAERMTD
jgi:uncharacterized ferritin-like protein (DUF455 family)